MPDMEDRSLFDEFERTDPTPKRWAEDSFSFLNRNSAPYWTKVRVELDDWFGDYVQHAGSAKAEDLRRRFRSADGRQHLPAWWELYVFRLLRCVYGPGTVLVEVDDPRGGARPDFVVMESETGRPCLYVEAVAPFSGIVEEGRHTGREAVVLDAINELEDPNFRLWVTVGSAGPEQPKKREIVEPLRRWLTRLNRERVRAAMQAGSELPSYDIETRGWKLNFRAIAKSEPGFEPGDRTVGVGPMSVGWVSDVADVRAAIERKKSRYGELDAPLVLAVMPVSPTFDDEDAVSVLLGSEAVRVDPDATEVTPVRLADGTWRDAEHVSAVLFGQGLFAWTVATRWPTLWLNPVAKQELGSELIALPRIVVTADGRLTRSDAAGPPSALFGLAADWPGPEEPFPEEN
jgi:hypothetical protein